MCWLAVGKAEASRAISSNLCLKRRILSGPAPHAAGPMAVHGQQFAGSAIEGGLNGLATRVSTPGRESVSTTVSGGRAGVRRSSCPARTAPAGHAVLTKPLAWLPITPAGRRPSPPGGGGRSGKERPRRRQLVMPPRSPPYIPGMFPTTITPWAAAFCPIDVNSFTVSLPTIAQIVAVASGCVASSGTSVLLRCVAIDAASSAEGRSTGRSPTAGVAAGPSPRRAEAPSMPESTFFPRCVSWVKNHTVNRDSVW